VEHKTFLTPITLLIQVADREPLAIGGGAYESEVQGTNVVVNPSEIRAAVRKTLEGALAKLDED
jgi:hypothetical protein